MALLKISTKYSIGDLVYIIADADQQECQVTAIVIIPVGHYYHVSMGSETIECYEIELANDKKVI